MKTRERAPAGHFAQRWTNRWPYPFEVTFTLVMALVLLGVASMAILQFRSPKYIVAFIVVAFGSTAFLMLPHKQYYLVLAVGFSLPYLARIILVSGENLLAITGTFVLTVLLALVCLATGKLRPERIILVPSITIPALLLVASGLLSMITTTDKTESVNALAQMLEMIFLFLVLVNSIRDKKYLIGFLRGLYLGFAIQCCIYVIQNIIGFSFDVVGNVTAQGTTDLSAGRIASHSGTLGSPAVVALYFSVFSMFLVGMFLCRKRLSIGLHPVLGMAMGTGCLILATKRAPLAGFAIGMLLMTLLIARYATGSKKRLFGVMAVLVIPALAFLPFLLLRAQQDHAEAYEVRKNLTRVAFNMFNEHPILGVGLGTYGSVKRDYLPEDWEGWLHNAHNRYLIVLAESGIVGLSAFLFLHLMMVVVAVRGIRNIAIAYRPLQIALICGLVAVLWEMIWDIFAGRSVGYFTWSLVTLSVVLPRIFPRSPRSEMA